METHPSPPARRGTGRLAAVTGPDLVDLTDEGATDAALVGAKAANLAVAQRAGLPVLPGAVLTTAWDRRGWSHPSRFGRPGPATAAWRTLGNEGARPLVVRSSSTNEDGATSSMAGMFTSVLDVVAWVDFVDAVDQVLDSGRLIDGPDARMAVLVQPQLAPRWGGVLFGADPVSGRTDRLLVSATRGGPDRLVSGLDDGWTAVLSRHGRVVDVRGGADDFLPRPALRALARLAAQAEDVFDGPQDIEWAIDDDDVLWLLQSRPVTTATGRPRGPVLGIGPLAETFPEPLSRLESDLWLQPLGQGLEQALLLTGAASPRALRRSPVVRDIEGWPVADLSHLGVAPPRHPVLHRLDPRPPARRLAAAWRTGRLARALPALGRDVVEQVDRDLAAVPRLDELSNGELLAVLDNGRTALRALHGYEALAGMLVPAHDGGVTAASMALAALAEARAEEVDMDELVEAAPVVLALAPPRIGPQVDLETGPPAAIDLRVDRTAAPPSLGPDPRADLAPGSGPGTGRTPDRADTTDGAVVREALRLRARWVQELMARAAYELGHRLTCVGVLGDQAAVRRLGLDELRDAVRIRTTPADLSTRVDPAIVSPRPLPARFQLTDDGVPVAVAPPTADPGGVGAGGGAGSGPVHVGDGPPAGAVLVVAHLDPRLAPVVPRLAGLVAETGSPLSHLAILAREHGVPTVVGHLGATERYQDGDLVAVDGTVGTVRLLDAVDVAPAPPDPLPPAVVATAGAATRTVITLPARPHIDGPDDPGDGAGGPGTGSSGGTVIPMAARR